VERQTQYNIGALRDSIISPLHANILLKLPRKHHVKLEEHWDCPH